MAPSVWFQKAGAFSPMKLGSKIMPANTAPSASSASGTSITSGDSWISFSAGA